MKRHIPLVLLLTVALFLSGCAGRSDLPTSATEDTPQAAESEKSTKMTTEETTMPENDTNEPILLLTIDGTAVDVQWENNAAVTELYALAQNAITVNTSAYGGFEQVGSLPQSFSRSDVQMTAQPGDIVLYSGNQLVVFFDSNSWSYTKLGHINGLSADELAALLDKEQTVIELQLKSRQAAGSKGLTLEQKRPQAVETCGLCAYWGLHINLRAAPEFECHLSVGVFYNLGKEKLKEVYGDKE